MKHETDSGAHTGLLRPRQSTGNPSVHFVDEGPEDAEIVWLCLHGEPTWSYLYRKMLPLFTAAGDRVIAPDFPGFGRSDKPVDDSTYTFDVQRNMLLPLIERLNLTGIRLVCQDWGGLLGLTLPLVFPDRFAGLLAMNTSFGTGDVPLRDGFEKWRDCSNSQHDPDVARLIQRAVTGLSDQEAQAYAAPFPDATYKACVRQFPKMVAHHPDADGAALSREARAWWTNNWTGKSLLAVGIQDPVLGVGAKKYLRRCIRNAPELMEIAQAGHFIRENGESVARSAVAALR